MAKIEVDNDSISSSLEHKYIYGPLVPVTVDKNPETRSVRNHEDDGSSSSLKIFTKVPLGNKLLICGPPEAQVKGKIK